MVMHLYNAIYKISKATRYDIGCNVLPGVVEIFRLFLSHFWLLCIFSFNII